jgi:hypothetical protein
MREFQIKAYGDKHLAAAIQEKLFELGYRWPMGGPNSVKLTSDSSYLVGYLVGACGKPTIMWANGDTYPLVGKEITLEKLFQMQPEAKETIKIGTQTYDKADFEAATKHLAPIK